LVKQQQQKTKKTESKTKNKKTLLSLAFFVRDTEIGYAVLFGGI